MCIPFNHAWEVIESGKYNVYEGAKRSDSLPVGTKFVYTLRCKKCGDVKLKKKTI